MKREIIIAVVAAAIVGVGSWFLGILQIVVAKVGGIFRSGLSFLGDRVVMPRWYYYLLVLSALALLARVGWSIMSLARKSDVTSVMDYRRDTFFGVVWRWEYLNSGGFIEKSLAPYCPSDDTVLVKNPDFTFDYENHELYCETCRKVYTPRQGTAIDLRGKIIRQIDRKLRTGEWREVVKSDPSRTPLG